MNESARPEEPTQATTPASRTKSVPPAGDDVVKHRSRQEFFDAMDAGEVDFSAIIENTRPTRRRRPLRLEQRRPPRSEPYAASVQVVGPDEDDVLVVGGLFA